MQPQCPQERGGTEQSHNGSVPPRLIQGLSPLVALAKPSPSLGVPQGLHPTCLDLVFPCLPQDSAFLAMSISLLSCPEVLVPSLPFALGQVSLCASWGRSSPSSPWTQPWILRENNKSLNWEQNSAQNHKGFSPWLELERKAASRTWLTGSSCFEEAHGI